MRKSVKMFEHELPVSNQDPLSNAAPEVATTCTSFATADLCVDTTEMKREETKQMLTSRMQTSITQTAEKAFLNVFWTGFELHKYNLENDFKVSLDDVLTDTAHNGDLETYLINASRAGHTRWYV